MVRVFGQPDLPLRGFAVFSVPGSEQRKPLGCLCQDAWVNFRMAFVLHIALKPGAQALKHGLRHVFSDHAVADAKLLANFGIGKVIQLRQ